MCIHVTQYSHGSHPFNSPYPVHLLAVLPDFSLIHLDCHPSSSWQTCPSCQQWDLPEQVVPYRWWRHLLLTSRWVICSCSSDSLWFFCFAELTKLKMNCVCVCVSVKYNRSIIGPVFGHPTDWSMLVANPESLTPHNPPGSIYQSFASTTFPYSHTPCVLPLCSFRMLNNLVYYKVCWMFGRLCVCVNLWALYIPCVFNNNFLYLYSVTTLVLYAI